MVINVPRHHNFPETFSKKISRKTGCPLPAWEISVPRKLDIAWSIVLSYLVSTKYNKSGNSFNESFARRLDALVGHSRNVKLVNKSIRRFNPFRNRWSCFYDEALKTVVDEFRKYLGWDNLLSISDKLSAACKVIGCPILLIESYGKCEKYRIFQKNAKRNGELITLIESPFVVDGKEDPDPDNPTKSVTVLNFMINNDLGLKMKTAALRYYLKESSLSKSEIKRLILRNSNDENFLITVLTSEYNQVILKLYDSPYVISKLSEAGYEMDPRTKDAEGYSALFYALRFSHHSILYKLYYFAADDCRQSRESYRNPNSIIVENLRDIERMLLNNQSKFKDPNREMNIVFKTKFDALLRLNKFLIESNSKILKITNELNSYESTEPKGNKENRQNKESKEEVQIRLLFEANKRRDVIVALLDTYVEFYKFENENTLTSSLLIDLYYTYYYFHIDITSAKIFFDNIVFLKQRLHVENCKLFSEMESCFMFSVLYIKVFDSIVNLNVMDLDFHENFLNSKAFHLYFLNQRLLNFDKIKHFSQELQSIFTKNYKTVKSIPEEEVNSILDSNPDFKNYIELYRLKNYIKLCLKTKVTDAKSVLAIERALQVIGECIPPKEKDDIMVKRFLSLCLPTEISGILRDLRHKLSHLNDHDLSSKIECEKNHSLFQSIQNEIIQIEMHFKPVYSIMDVTIGVYASELIEKELMRILGFFLSEIPKVEKDYIFKKYRNDLFKKFKSPCRIFFERALEIVNDEIGNELSSGTRGIDDVKKQIIHLLKPIKKLLELMQQCGLNSVAALDVCKEFEECDMNSIDRLKEQRGKFLTECKNFLLKWKIYKKRKIIKPLESVQNIEHFLKSLKASLSDEEKREIRQDIPQVIRKGVAMKDELIKSIKNDFSLNVEENFAMFEITYFSKSKIRELKEFYKCKDSYALTILESRDPIAEIEKIFSDNYVQKNRYDKICETMQFSNKTRKILGKLVAGQAKMYPANNLLNLHNRIQLLRELAIEDDEEVQNLWLRIKREKSRQLIVDKIVRCCEKDRQLQAAVETLLVDCMELIKKVKMLANPSIKSSNFYRGINLRNVMCHGSPILEFLCQMLDPQDFASEIVRKIIFFIKDEDTVTACLQLFEITDWDVTKFREIVNCDEKDEYSSLRDQIRKCDEWEKYVLLLP